MASSTGQDPPTSKEEAVHDLPSLTPDGNWGHVMTMERKAEEDVDEPSTRSWWELFSSFLYTILVSWQASLQSKWKPASWLNFCYKCHSQEAEWTMQGIPKDAAMDQMWMAAQELKGFAPRSNLVVNGQHVLVVDVFTKVYWMDQITVIFEATTTTRDDSSSRLVAESTGMLPLCVPLACFVNLALFWFPFLDTNGACGKSMERLRNEMENKSGRSIKSHTVRYSRSVKRSKKKE